MRKNKIFTIHLTVILNLLMVFPILGQQVREKNKIESHKLSSLKKRKGFLGHSLGGLFGAYLIQKEPTLIDDYILISGSLDWNENEHLKEDLFDKFKNLTKLKQLYLTYGKSEIKRTTKSNEIFNTIIVNLEKNNLNYTMKVYEEQFMTDYYSFTKCKLKPYKINCWF